MNPPPKLGIPRTRPANTGAGRRWSAPPSDQSCHRTETAARLKERRILNAYDGGRCSKQNMKITLASPHAKFWLGAE